MGYRYGRRKYSEGLYSRWPDWWQDKSCAADAWQDTSCPPPVWAPGDLVRPPLSPWEPAPVTLKAVPGFRTAGGSRG